MANPSRLLCKIHISTSNLQKTCNFLWRHATTIHPGAIPKQIVFTLLCRNTTVSSLTFFIPSKGAPSVNVHTKLVIMQFSGINHVFTLDPVCVVKSFLDCLKPTEREHIYNKCYISVIIFSITYISFVGLSPVNYCDQPEHLSLT